MKIVAAPTFNEKVVDLPSGARKEVALAIDRLESSGRMELGEFLVPISSKDGVFVFRTGGVRIFLSFGDNNGEEYALLVDLALPHDEYSRNIAYGDHHIPFGSDPIKNMTINPNRNMTIDPRRNMTIDPRRNMMIDPRRNMMIDPRRNFLINPQKNSLIDPSRNSIWNGAFLFSLDRRPTSFFVRADAKVSLQFDMRSNFIGFCVLAGENLNRFDLGGIWISFFAKNGGDGHNHFEISGSWIGFATKRILSNSPEIG
jgi:hypothetical protein